MAIIRLKDYSVNNSNVYYEFDTDSALLGEGGMGKVYKGRQISELTGITHDVAIKFLFEGLPKSIIDRARREAGIQVKSDNLVEMMGFFETTYENANHTKLKHFHVVSELLTGVMLADLLNGQTATKEGREIMFAQNLYKMYKEDRANFALIIMKNIAAGIMTLHDKGFIHRDIDPTNIMVTDDGKIKLIDFGIAKKRPNHNANTGELLSTQDRSLTMTGQFIGKPQYAAPELVVGDINYQNETTDIYAMGILLFQLLTGHLPFSGPITKVLDAQKNKKTPVRNIKGVEHLLDFRKIIAKATEKDQEKRFKSAAEFRAALDSIGTKSTHSPWLIRIGGIACALVVLVMGFFLFTKLRNDTTGIDKEIEKELYYAQTAEEGWKHLLERDDAHSLFIQSRIYYKGETKLEDSIKIMRNNLKAIVSPDSVKAHKLLEKAYSLDPDNARILFYMGADFCDGNGVTLDYEKAMSFMEKAHSRAKATNDVIIIERVPDAIDWIKYKSKK